MVLILWMLHRGGGVRASADVADVADAGEIVGIEGVAGVEHAETDVESVDGYRGAAFEALEVAVTTPNSIPTPSLAAADRVEEPAPSHPPPSTVPPSSYPPFLLCPGHPMVGNRSRPSL